MTTRRPGSRSASLFALLLFVPLIHGAGAHLVEIETAVHAADDVARASTCHSADIAPEMSKSAEGSASHRADHAALEFCALCVTARSAWVRGAAEGLPIATVGREIVPRQDSGALRVERPRGDPDAPRAPPTDLA